MRDRRVRAMRVLVVGSVGAMLICSPAWAGNNGWFTTYNSEVEQGELELMLMNDITQPAALVRENGVGDYFSHMAELEYGLTDRFATELMVEWFEDLDSGEKRFTGVRWENRYRLFAGEVPLNPMVYAEYEDLDVRTRYKMEVSGWRRPPYTETSEESERERILETRLVLSEDVGPVNVAFNWINETDLRNGLTAFGYSAGLMWMIHSNASRSSAVSAATVGDGAYGCPMHADVRENKPGTCPKCGMALTATSEGSGASGCGCARKMKGCTCSHCGGRGGKCPCVHEGGVGMGLEVFGALGDTRAFGLSLPRQEHYLGPILMYHVTSRLMVHAQLALGLSAASDHIARVNIGYEF